MQASGKRMGLYPAGPFVPLVIYVRINMFVEVWKSRILCLIIHGLGDLIIRNLMVSKHLLSAEWFFF